MFAYCSALCRQEAGGRVSGGRARHARGQKQRAEGQAGQGSRRTLPYLQLGIVLHGLHAQAAAHFKLYEVNTDSTSGPRAPALSLWSRLRTDTSRHSIES